MKRLDSRRGRLRTDNLSSKCTDLSSVQRPQSWKKDRIQDYGFEIMKTVGRVLVTKTAK